jgi:Lon protease-like protein
LKVSIIDRNPAGCEEVPVDITTIPVLPLNAVLLPGTSMSLRIFEDRYLRLLADRAAEEVVFAVSRIVQGQEVGGEAEFHPIGTTARLTTINAVSASLIEIIVTGDERISLGDVDWQHGYATASKTLMPDLPFDETETLALAGKQVRSFSKLLRLASRYIPGDFPLPITVIDPEATSYELARWLPLTIFEQQDLLEEQDPAARLQYIGRIIRRETRLITRGGVAAFPIPQPGTRFSIN